ncbi:MAG TPA: hypothetical protein VLA19_17345, partial [Herpetosiphonaceae bacterium]|nr:hypothetical protein [Herpetosiphonaceae bacterium]
RPVGPSPAAVTSWPMLRQIRSAMIGGMACVSLSRQLSAVSRQAGTGFGDVEAASRLSPPADG